MKKTLFFVLGAISSIAILIVLAYFFFLRGGSPNGQKTLGEDIITLTGTIHVPPPLASAVNNGKGVTIFTLGFAPRLFPTLLLRDSIGLTFPHKFSFSIPRTLISSNLPPGELDFFVSANYFPNLTQTEGLSVTTSNTEPLVLARGMATVTAGELSKNKTYDFGNVFFSRHYPRGGRTPCLGTQARIAGKITPSADFLKKNATAKFALASIEEQFSIFNFPYLDTKPTDKELDQALPPSQYKMVDFSSGPVSFSFPKVPTKTNWIRLFVVKCTAGQSLRACAANVFPMRAFSPQMAHRYRLVGKNFEAAFCGQTNYEAFVDQPDGVPAISHEVPNPANPIVPQEFIPGLYL